ncbi:MAG: LysR family transcriptional regulator [Kangiellaceae bacterium]|nr:LysR family transcriptional regulator [Kangiellaceae bacterium]
MNWNDLKYFLALSREGSVSGAGRAMGVKHTTVARRITSLEKSLGTRLFDRTKSGYAMTLDAENLYATALSMEEKARNIDRVAANQDSALAGPLKLTIAFELANRLILPNIGEFCQLYPNIDLQLLMTKGLVDLSSMEADLAIRMTPNPPDYLVGQEIMKLRHGIYTSKKVIDDPPSTNRVILFRDETLQPAWVKQHFRHANVAIRVDDVGSMAVAAAHGVGIAKLPCFIGDTEPGLIRLDYEVEKSNWGIWVLNHVDLRATKRVKACKEFLIELLKSKKSIIAGELSRSNKKMQ